MHKLHALLRRSRTWDKKRVALIVGGSLLGLLLVVQLFFPGDRLLPFARIDGRAVALMKRTDATKLLNDAYNSSSIDIYMGTGKKPVVTPTLQQAGVRVDNTTRIKNLTYPWYLRIIPTSLFWAGLKSSPTPKPQFNATFSTYIETNLMPRCREDPVDATLKAQNDKLVVVAAQNGGACAQQDVVTSIKRITPILTKPTSIKVARTEIKPVVGDSIAKAKADELNSRLENGLVITVNGAPVGAPKKDVISWLDFSSQDKTVVATVNLARTQAWLEANVAAKVAIAPGTSAITTKDFTEVSRIDGSPGQAINIAATIASMQAVIEGKLDSATTLTKVVPPIEKYTRTYSPSDAGLTALVTNYAKDHPGSYGVSMVELDGKKRRTDYNADAQFVTASTYKMFVAYSLMKQIDSGKRDWDSNATCFNKMISQSDNACAESFLNSLGLSTVTKDVQAIGLANSTFMKAGGPFTTAKDLTLLTGMVATGQNFSPTNQQRLISAMKGNVFRKGIPAGVQGTVADKVGFIDDLLHDTAIVYGPNGTYILTIMTKGASWGSIADLARQLDTLRAQ